MRYGGLCMKLSPRIWEFVQMPTSAPSVVRCKIGIFSVTCISVQAIPLLSVLLLMVLLVR